MAESKREEGEIPSLHRLYSVHWTVYIGQCTLYSVHCTVCIVQCTLYMHLLHICFLVFKMLHSKNKKM